jgi:hypothetical protein
MCALASGENSIGLRQPFLSPKPWMLIENKKKPN